MVYYSYVGMVYYSYVGMVYYSYVGMVYYSYVGMVYYFVFRFSLDCFNIKSLDFLKDHSEFNFNFGNLVMDPVHVA